MSRGLGDVYKRQVPDGFTEENLQWNNSYLPAYQTTKGDPILSDAFYLFYAYNNEGNAAFYLYDVAEGSFQRYFAIQETAAVTERMEQKSVLIIGTLAFLLVCAIVVIVNLILHNRDLKLDMEEEALYGDETEEEKKKDEKKPKKQIAKKPAEKPATEKPVKQAVKKAEEKTAKTVAEKPEKRVVKKTEEKAAKPTKIKSLSQFLCTEEGAVLGRSRYPMASTRSASPAYICKMSPRCFFCRELSGFSPSFVNIFVQRDKRISGAPFVIQRRPPEKEWIVVILFLLESNGISSIKGKLFSHFLQFYHFTQNICLNLFM